MEQNDIIIQSIIDKEIESSECPIFLIISSFF